MLLFVRALLQRRRSKTEVNNPIIKDVCAHEENTMKGFKKLALVSAIAALPMSGFAMQALDDETMSNVTGQDGLTVGITTPVAGMTMDIIIHDNDGLTGAPDAGAIVIDQMKLTTPGEIKLVIDASDNSASPLLNIAVTIPTGTTITTGDLSVATSGGIGTTAGADNTDSKYDGRSVSNQTATILDSMDITLGSTTLDIQLGNVAQIVGGTTRMIDLTTTMNGGL